MPPVTSLEQDTDWAHGLNLWAHTFFNLDSLNDVDHPFSNTPSLRRDNRIFSLASGRDIPVGPCTIHPYMLQDIGVISLRLHIWRERNHLGLLGFNTGFLLTLILECVLSTTLNKETLPS